MGFLGTPALPYPSGAGVAFAGVAGRDGRALQGKAPSIITRENQGKRAPGSWRREGERGVQLDLPECPPAPQRGFRVAVANGCVSPKTSAARGNRRRGGDTVCSRGFCRLELGRT